MSSQFSPTRSWGVGSRPVMVEKSQRLFYSLSFDSRLALISGSSYEFLFFSVIHSSSSRLITCGVLRCILFHDHLLDWLKKKGLQTFLSTNIQCMKLSSGEQREGSGAFGVSLFPLHSPFNGEPTKELRMEFPNH